MTEWNTLRSLEILRNYENVNLSDNLKDVSIINRHFLAINHVIITPEQLSLLDKYSTEKTQLFNFHTVDVNTIRKYLNSITRNATGSDQLSLRTLKYTDE
ncbi:hypothetical protein JTB14_031151 [Gonioctena quinquepunctata]|nr:hypothetical protein JTB14_031151 [Gonioctena quinquepunctata]